MQQKEMYCFCTKLEMEALWEKSCGLQNSCSLISAEVLRGKGERKDRVNGYCKDNIALSHLCLLFSVITCPVVRR